MAEVAPRTLPIIKLPFTGVYALRVAFGPTDPISDLPVVMDFLNHQRHEGEVFHAIDARATLNATTVKYGITVPVYANTIQAPHMMLAAEIYNGAALVLLYEDATFTGGTALTTYNINRNSANTDGTTITAGVTSTNGTLIDAFYAGAGAKAAGSNGIREEWILKSNTIYRVDFIGQIDPTTAYMKFEYYADKGV